MVLPAIIAAATLAYSTVFPDGHLPGSSPGSSRGVVVRANASPFFYGFGKRKVKGPSILPLKHNSEFSFFLILLDSHRGVLFFLDDIRVETTTTFRKASALLLFMVV